LLFAICYLLFGASFPNPADAGCNSDLAQYSNTPSLRAAGFEDEDDDEDENESPRKLKASLRLYQ